MPYSLSDYIVHRIPKKSGGLRILHEPKPELKALQKRVLRWMQARGLGGGRRSHAFERGRSIATHARLHVGRKVVVRLDLKDFFGSTTDTMVRLALMMEGVGAEQAQEIVDICSLGGTLPQGGPASPLLANVAAKRMDLRLASLAESRKAVYSRYADDLTFSADDADLNGLIPAVDAIVSDCGYRLNRKKTLVMRSGRRQLVTGLVVNKGLNAPRELRRNLRAQLHGLKCSLLNAQDFDYESFEQAKGMSAFVISVNPDASTRLRQSIKEIESLMSMREQMATAYAAAA